jgi:hypothetical protein
MTRSSAKLRVVGTGHRSYIDNVTLISTRVLRAPLPKGHRQWSDCLRHRAGRAAHGAAARLHHSATIAIAGER